jgi:hypothetical protein
LPVWPDYIFGYMEARIQAGVKLGKPKLLDQVRTVLRLQHYSLRTEQGYVDWIKRFVLLDGVGKVFVTTLLAQAVKQGELSLDDPVAKYVTELQRGGDIRQITLGQLASHTSGLPRVPQQYETCTRVDIHGQLLSGSLIPGRRARTMNLGNSISIPMRLWCCFGWPSSADSTRVSRP